MKERPMMFITSSVQQILAGQKTQTRRLIKPQPPDWVCSHVNRSSVQDLFQWTEAEQNPLRKLRRWPEDHYMACPYGYPITRLWCKETWAETYKTKKTTAYVYKANNPEVKVKWRSSMFMPRRASRINLEIVAVRAERLQEITESDAAAEGIITIERSIYRHGRMNGYGIPGTPPDEAGTTRVNAYAMLWDSINKGRGEVLWNDNPFVWVITFKRI